ncbi:MAG: hypothetical protein TQ35_0004970 [Candidatus Aramenus sulfurataquae]|jgi:hypothetical protein|uniref:Uncharacterized protein n=2 Tax=Candidatus Aramenus sulfurataquae TaxID=1326980 RepID=A0A0F2LLT5_9CREN|nr:hypothetical protein [Candidatus Aramenus sp.]MCL7344027.1 hypothetical protein [Candidatus Aramenus sulfurataquae]
MTSNFSVSLYVLTEPQRTREVFLGLDKMLSDMCKPIRIGASYICSPSDDLLVSVFLNDDVKRYAMVIKVEGKNASELVDVVSKINEKLKEMGVHASLFSSFKSSL